MTSTDKPASLLTETINRSPEWAAQNIDTLVMRGSHSHGTYIEPTDDLGTDDVDVFALAVQSARTYVGLDSKDVFETAGETLDILVYDIRKFAALLAKGNPNVHQCLWTPEESVLLRGPAYDTLVLNRTRLLSDAVSRSLFGYAEGQKVCMTRGGTKKRYMGEKRAGLMAKHGYDTKNAAHCLRLLISGYELFSHNNFMVKLPEGLARDRVMAVKRGDLTIEQTLAEITAMEKVCRAVYEEKRFDWMRLANLPREAVNSIMIDAMEESWQSRRKAYRIHGE